MDLLDYIKEKSNSPEQKRFKMWTYFNYHLSLYQDFNGANLQVQISHSNDDEHNWLIHLHILFWGLEYSWNSRRDGKLKRDKGQLNIPDVCNNAMAVCVEPDQNCPGYMKYENGCKGCEHWK